MLLALKLFLVPAFLALVSHASRRWGPSVGGWLAGMPLVTGPILFILALENEASFTARVAAFSLSAVVAAIVFGASYSHLCLRLGWLASALGALAAWFASAALLTLLPGSVLPSLVAAIAALLVAPRLFPKPPPVGALRAEPRYELPLRMGVAVCMVLFTTGIAQIIGTGWTGLLSMFPLLSTILAVFSHRAQGPGFAVIILGALAKGLYALTAYCLVVALFLESQGIAVTYVGAVLAVILVQAITRPRKRASG